MDQIDRLLISLLQHDGRLPQAQLAAETGLSQSAVHERLRRLTSSGAVTIVGVADPQAVDLTLLAFVFVGLDRPERDEGFRQAMSQEPAVLECHHITGDWSYLLKIRAATVADLESVLTERIKRQPGIVRSHTMLALSTTKETHCLPVLPVLRD
ncbi:MAG: Lrp/AsnC family transcriptional regulator [Elstera sp.]